MTKWIRFSRSPVQHTRDARLCVAWTLPCNWSHYFHHPCSVNQADTSIHGSSSSCCHWISVVVFLILRLAIPVSVWRHPSSFRAKDKWRIDWISVSLWETNLLMRRAALVPHSSASSRGYSRYRAHKRTSAPLWKSNGAQNELWM